LNGLPEGVDVVGIADGPVSSTESEPVYYWECGVRGGKNFTVNRGTILVKPMDGYSFEYDYLTDSYIATKTMSAPKIITVRMKVASSFQERKLRENAPLWPGFISLEEEPAEVTA
jgi:hypothetical protein